MQLCAAQVTVLLILPLLTVTSDFSEALQQGSKPYHCKASERSKPDGLSQTTVMAGACLLTKESAGDGHEHDRQACAGHQQLYPDDTVACRVQLHAPHVPDHVHVALHLLHPAQHMQPVR